MTRSRCASCGCRMAPTCRCRPIRARIAAGLDLLAAVPADAPVDDRAGATRDDPDRHRASRSRPAPKAGAAALGARRKHGVTVLNSPGTSTPTTAAKSACCSSTTAKPFAVARGMRIAQLVVAPILRVTVSEAEPSRIPAAAAAALDQRVAVANAGRRRRPRMAQPRGPGVG